MTDSEIHVLVASDNAYFKGLVATTVSLVAHCSRPRDLVVHVLDGGLSDEHRDAIRKLVAPRQSIVRFIPVDQTMFGHLAPWHGTGRMAYARLLAPEILRDIQHVIYCDIDVLWEADVSRLWDLRSDSDSLQYVRDASRSHGDPAEDRWLTEHGLSLDSDNYFCSGLLLMNLAKFRAESLHKKTLDLLGQTGGEATYPDQTILNVVFSRRTDTSELPAEWQVASSDRKHFSTGGWAGLIHFAGDCPWKPLRETNHLLTDLHLLWHRMYSSAAGISVWQSLREANSLAWIILGRGLYLAICHMPFFRRLLSAFLKVQGKSPAFLDSVFRCRKLTADHRV